LFQRGKEAASTAKAVVNKPKAEKQIEIQNTKMEELINKFRNAETTK
jgi:hypothetical protein